MREMSITFTQQKARKNFERRNILSMTIVVALFGVAWLPLDISRTIAVLNPDLDIPAEFVMVAFFMSDANSLFNPFLYTYSNHYVRRGLRKMPCFKRCFKEQTMSINVVFAVKHAFKRKKTEPYQQERSGSVFSPGSIINLQALRLSRSFDLGSTCSRKIESKPAIIRLPCVITKNSDTSRTTTTSNLLAVPERTYGYRTQSDHDESSDQSVNTYLELKKTVQAQSLTARKSDTKLNGPTISNNLCSGEDSEEEESGHDRISLCELFRKSFQDLTYYN